MGSGDSLTRFQRETAWQLLREVEWRAFLKGIVLEKTNPAKTGLAETQRAFKSGEIYIADHVVILVAKRNCCPVFRTPYQEQKARLLSGHSCASHETDRDIRQLWGT